MPKACTRAVLNLSIAACIAAAVMLSVPGCSGDAGKGETARPDVLIITLDTTRADHMGFLGSSEVKTPNLDSLAAGSVVFRECFSTAHSTNPSHASIFTSLYMRDHGVLDNRHVLPEYSGFMPRLFGAAGYRTAAFTSGGHLDRNVNIDQGFADFTCPSEGYEAPADATTDAVLEWLGRYGGKSGPGDESPFFVWVHYFDPHFKYQPPAPYDGMYRNTSDDLVDWVRMSDERNRDYLAGSQDPEYFRNLYKGEVSFMDAQLGRVLARLKQMGRYDSSVIVVVADHGESLGEHGIFWDHRGLYDVSIRVPLVIKPAGRFEPGMRGQLVSTVDIYPTVLELAGLKTDNPVMGRSLAGILADTGAPEVRKEAFFQSVLEEYIGIRTREYTYIRRVKGKRGLEGSSYLGGHSAIVELYDNAMDPDQMINAAALRPEVTSSFEKSAGEFINDRAHAQRAGEITDKAHLEKLRALGYVQ